MPLLKKSLLLGCFTLFTVLLFAGNGAREKKGGEPSINGMVADADSKKPVSGVVVSIVGKGQEKKELTTDAQGNFKTGTLAPGEVTITFEKKGYRTVRKENVVVKEGNALRLMLELEQQDEDDDVFHPLLRMLFGD